jgi:lysophospholipase L1-like esterase
VHRPNFRGRWDGTWYETDARGFRGADCPPPGAGAQLRVACFGDSCTFGKGVLEDETWPRQLERLLQAELGPERRAVVANMGVNGYAGAEYAEAARRNLQDFAPDVVIVGYNLNDFPNVLRAADEAVFQERGLRRAIPDGLRDGLNRLACYRWLRARYYDTLREEDWRRSEEFAREAGQGAQQGAQQGAPAGGGREREVWANQESVIDEIRDLAAAEGAELAVFLFPYESQVYLARYDDAPIVRIEEICGRLGVPFASLAEAFRAAARETQPPRELFLLGDRYHPRAEGYSIVAEHVLELMRESGWLAAD